MAEWIRRSHQRGNQIGLKTALSLMGCQEIQRDTEAPSLSLSHISTNTDLIITSESDILTCLEPADTSCEPHPSMIIVNPSHSEGPNHPEYEADPKALFEKLKEEGNICYQQEMYHEALNKYMDALNCSSHCNIKEQIALIRANCAMACLKLQMYGAAYTHCVEWVKLDPENHKAYLCRAEVQKKALDLQSSIRSQSIISGITYKIVIADYCRAHELKTNSTAIVEAIIVAIDNGHSDMMRHVEEMPLDFCNEVFIELLSRHECKQAHMEFLITKMWNKKVIDISKITLKHLIVEKHITSASLLQRFLSLGLCLNKESIKMAMNCLQSNQLHLFKFIAAKSDPLYFDELYHVATMSANPMTFMLIFAELGANVPPNHVEELLVYTLRTGDYYRALSLGRKFKKSCLEEVDLISLLKSDVANYPELIEVLLENGVNPNKCDKIGKTPIAMVMDRYPTWTKKIELVCLLLDKGEHCNHLSCTGSIKSCTTPLLVATEVALETGDLRLINSVVRSPSFDRQKVVNVEGESPLHLAIKSHWKKAHSIKILSALLETGVLDPSHRDKTRRRPLDYLREPDERFTMLKEAIIALNPNKRQESKKGSMNTNRSTKSQKQPETPYLTADVNVEFNDKHNSMKMELQVKQAALESKNNSEQNRQQDSQSGKEVNERPEKPASNNKRMHSIQIKDGYKVLCDKLDKHMKRLKSKEPQYFNEIIQEVAASHDDEMLGKEESVPLLPKKERSTPDNHKVGKKQDMEPLEDPTSIFAEYVDGQDFNDLPWEVEITAKVIKFFKGIKNTPFKVRKAAAETIYRLANGERDYVNLSKLVSHNNKSVQLFEAKMTKAARILWEKAISYSARLTGTACASAPVYTEVIRVWEIVLDHDSFHERIKYCIEQIETSHQCGFRLPLLPQRATDPNKNMGKVRGRKKLDIPMTFLLQTKSEKKIYDYQFAPAVSINDGKYSFTTLYSFDTVTFKSMLFGTNDRRDFPFKEWHIEHEIIQLPYTEAILLLGRSGTGKTTCCVYRLWNEFKIYWNPSSITFGSKIQRRQLGLSAPERKTVGTSNLVESACTPEYSAIQEVSSSGAEVGESTEIVTEDLHQVFITKNYVLCSQVKKHFYNMAAACDFLEYHMQFEMTNIATDLSKVDDYAFPLFLTARQFYILLDNSLPDDQTFFKRDKDSNLMVKIISLDYDHDGQNILLVLEQNDRDEDKEEDESVSTKPQLTSKDHTEQWTEVTALYFKECIWPTISHQCGITSKDFIDPLLVWIEIQSFIKGSESALRKGSHLNLEEYKQIGNRMAPNFSNLRDTIYKVFLKYQKYQQNQRHHNFLFDECDLVLHLYNRLKRVRDVPWSIHSLYIDEVQDFTQAELAVFIHCCQDPNSIFFTGDTTQSIMRGIAFRFEDLRSIFHKLHSQHSEIKVPQKPYNLTINFRSHSGILKLAGSIIDLISEFFGDSIDHLPNDEGTFPGPTPIVLDACNDSDLALLLSSNKREQSAIDFGAHQAILVQSKENLPSIFEGAIVMTIFEAKGLEFDDILLYNFFTNSIVDEKCWRVISSYLEMPQHDRKKVKSLPNCPRSQLFDPKLHKSLNSELKYLYTAITRAKCHLWIYDSDCDLRRPMFDYWQRRDLVLSKPVQILPSVGGQGGGSQGFASTSTPEQWKAQGDNLMKRRLWEQATQCYIRASPENEYLYLAKEAHACHLIQQAKYQKPQLYLQAAVCFLDGDKLQHNLHYLHCAAFCLKKSNPPKHLEVATLFEHLGKSEKAAHLYLKGKDTESYAKLKESMGQHIKVIKTLLGRLQKREALKKASEYEKQGIVLPRDLCVSELSYSLANFYSKMGDKKTLCEVLYYMPEVDRKTKFFKDAGLYDEAFEILKHQELKDAYRLASAQGGCRQNPSDYYKSKYWLKKGMELAEKSQDEATRASFVLQMAKVEYIMRQANEDKHVKEDKEAFNNVRTLLQCKDQLVRAQALLLFGIITKDSSFCSQAQRIYHTLQHTTGELEAFNQILLLSNKDSRLEYQLLLDACHKAKEVSIALRNASDMNKVVKEVLSFHGLKKIGDYCYTPQHQDILWITGWSTKSKYMYKTREYDSDGMLKLKVSHVRSELATRYQIFKDSWLSYSALKSELQQKQMAFSLHHQLWKEPHCLKREYSMTEVSAEALCNYLQALVHLLELHTLKEERNESDKLISLLVAIFTPEVHIYIPDRITNTHISIIRRSVNSYKKFQLFVKCMPFTTVSSHPLGVENWLKAWRGSCISQPDMKVLFGVLRDLENVMNSKYCIRGEKPPRMLPGFIFWKKDKKLRHIFSLWLNSCVEIREKGQFLWASKLAIFYFLGTIIKHPSQYRIRVVSIVDILSVHCTGLLVTLTHINFIQNLQGSFIIPHLYKKSVQLFNSMISWRKEDITIFSACAKAVHSLESKIECYQVLIGALEHLVSTSSYSDFSLLRFSLENIVSTDAAKQCLILALVLFGNLSIFNFGVQQVDNFGQKINRFYQEILFLLQGAMNLYRENTPEYILMAHNTISTSNSSTDIIFSLVERLLHDAKVDSTLAWLIMIKRQDDIGRVEIKPIRSSTQRQASLPQASTPTVSCVPPPPGFPPSLQRNAGSAGNLQYSNSSEHYPHLVPGIHDIPQYSTTEWEQVPIRSQKEEEHMALTCGAMEQWLQIDPELINPEIVTHTYCNVCGVHLKADHIFCGVEELGQDVDVAMPRELYDIHVHSRLHESNIFVHKKLMKILSNENGDQLYPNLRQELTNLLQDCQELQSNLYGRSELNRCIDDIEEELGKNERILAELQENYSWRQAVEEITGPMIESMDRLMKRGQEIYSEVNEQFKHRIDAKFETKQEDSEDDDIDPQENIERELDYFSEQYAVGKLSSLSTGRRRN